MPYSELCRGLNCNYMIPFLIRFYISFKITDDLPHLPSPRGTVFFSQISFRTKTSLFVYPHCEQIFINIGRAERSERKGLSYGIRIEINVSPQNRFESPLAIVVVSCRVSARN